jgi:hypothetical protein
MRAFLAEFEQGKILKTDATRAVARAFEVELENTGRGPGRPKKGAEGVWGRLNRKLNDKPSKGLSQPGRTLMDLLAAIDRARQAGAGWSAALRSVGEEFGITPGGIKEALKEFDAHTREKFDTFPKLWRPLDVSEHDARRVALRLRLAKKYLTDPEWDLDWPECVRLALQRATPQERAEFDRAAGQ